MSNQSKEKLISGISKAGGAIAGWLCLNIGLAIGAIIFSIFIGEEGLGIEYEIEIAMIVGLIIVGFSGFLFGIWGAISMSKTKIDVYEDKLEGIALGKGFIWGDCRTFNFMLSIEQITSVEVLGSNQNVLVVYGPNARYKIYASNSVEIRNTIFSLKNQGK